MPEERINASPSSIASDVQNLHSCLLTPHVIARILWELSRLQVRLSKLRNKSSDGPHGLFGFFVAQDHLSPTGDPSITVRFLPSKYLRSSRISAVRHATLGDLCDLGASTVIPPPTTHPHTRYSNIPLSFSTSLVRPSASISFMRAFWPVRSSPKITPILCSCFPPPS